MAPDVLAGPPTGQRTGSGVTRTFIRDEESNSMPPPPEISSAYESAFGSLERQEEYVPMPLRSITKWSPCLEPHAIENIRNKGPTLYYPAPIETPVASPLTDFGAGDSPSPPSEEPELLGDSSSESQPDYAQTMDNQGGQTEPEHQNQNTTTDVPTIFEFENHTETRDIQTRDEPDIGTEAIDNPTKSQIEDPKKTEKEPQAQDVREIGILSTKHLEQLGNQTGQDEKIHIQDHVVHELKKEPVRQTETLVEEKTQHGPAGNLQQTLLNNPVEKSHEDSSEIQEGTPNIIHQIDQSIQEGTVEKAKHEGIDVQDELAMESGPGTGMSNVSTEATQDGSAETLDEPLEESQVHDIQQAQGRVLDDARAHNESPLPPAPNPIERAKTPERSRPVLPDLDSSPLSDIPTDIQDEILHQTIRYERDEGSSHILRLKPTLTQWADFPTILSFARQQGAELDGCFKVVLPDGALESLPDKPAQKFPANAFKPQLLRPSRIWRVGVVPTEGDFPSSSDASRPRFIGTAEEAVKRLSKLFSRSRNRQIRDVRYRVDVPAWTVEQRIAAGVPGKSPLHPLRGDKLDSTKAIIPGIHTPYVYESGPAFGATFQIHAEDFRLSSLNHLYKGRKIWIIVPSAAVNLAEEKLERNEKCSQFMRHRAEFVFPEKLKRLGIPFRLIDQSPGETIVILPDAYHEGFSTGYTLAEAKNYAESTWNTDKYQPCDVACQLATAIPGDFMQIIKEGESRLDLCASFDSEPSTPTKRTRDDDDTESESDFDQGSGRPSKRAKRDADDTSPSRASVLM